MYDSTIIQKEKEENGRFCLITKPNKKIIQVVWSHESNIYLYVPENITKNPNNRRKNGKGYQLTRNKRKNHYFLSIKKLELVE